MDTAATRQDGRIDRRRLVIGLGALAALASGGVLFWSASNSRGVSREERLAARAPFPAAGPGGERPRFGGGGPPAMGAANNPMTSELGLSDDQQKRLDALRRQNEPKMREAIESMRDPSLTDEQRRAKMDEIRDGMREQMRQVLTPEQQQKFDARAAEMEQRMEERRSQMQGRMSETRERIRANGQEPPEFPPMGGPGGFPGGAPGGGMPFPPPSR